LIIQLPSIRDVLHCSQLKVLDDLARFNVLEIGRRWGKTTFGTQITLDDAVNGKKVGWFAPTYKYLAEPMRDIERGLRPIIERIDRVEKRITLITGGSIDFWSLEDREAGRGRAYHRVVVDEAGIVPSLIQIWQEALRPTTVDYKGGALFLGTPKGTGDFHKLYNEAEGDSDGIWKAFRVATIENPFIDPAEIAEARRMLPLAIFNQEFEGIPAEDGGNPFGIDAIRDCAAPSLSTDRTEVYGVDLAKSHDWTVVCGLDSNGRVSYLERWHGPWSVTRERLASLLRHEVAYIDSTGVGDPIVEDLRKICPRVEGFKFTSQSKQSLMTDLQIAIQTREIRFPDGWLRAELESFGFRYSKGDHIFYEAVAGHDDGVCALALAVHGRRKYRPLFITVI
jgi:hypothetical protein